MSEWFYACIWGWFAGSALLLGAFIGYYFDLTLRQVSAVMAFGSGVLISALSFEIMEEAYQTGGFLATSIGFLIGASIYSAASMYLNTKGARHRKRSIHNKQISEEQMTGSGMALAVGALLDGIPESLVIGLSILSGKGVGLVVVFAFFISNIPEGLSSSSGMKKAGRSKKYVFTLWSGIFFISGLASFAGYSIFSKFSPEVVATTMATAGGGVLAMIVDTMIPEAYQDEHEWAGMITVVGFLISFIMSKWI